MPLSLDTGVFWSLRIENRGRTAAQDCVGAVTFDAIAENQLIPEEEADIDERLPNWEDDQDQKFPRRQILQPGYFRKIDSVSLCWSKLGNPELIEINPGINQSLDICKVHRGKFRNYFIIPSEFGWKKLRCRVAVETLSGEIKICPSNEFPTRIRFRISIEGDGKCVFTCRPAGLINRLFRQSGRFEVPFLD